MSARILRLCAVAAIAVIASLSLGTTVGLAQQNADLAPLLEELLKRLPGGADESATSESIDAGDDAAEDGVDEDLVLDGPLVPPAAINANESAPAVASTTLPPVGGPEADLARRLLAITDTEETKEEVRVDLAAEFVRRLRGPLLETPLAEDEAEATESALVLAQDPVGIPDGEELIFEVRIDNRRFLQSLFGIKQGDGILVDLAEAAELLEFAIDVDAATASGFFIDPTKTFVLDLDAGTATIEGETIPVTGEDIRRLDDAILVHSDTFLIWFSVRLDVDFRDLIVNLVPETPIPLQQRFQRQQRIADLRRARRSPPSLPLIDDPYRAIDWPFADVRLQSSLLDVPGQELRTRQSYSVVGRGDLGLGTGEFFVSGTKDDVLNSARLTVRREDPAGGLLGPLQATRIEAGDVVAPGLKVSGTGVGAFITNNTSGIQNLGTSTDFVGIEQPGTDIELYRNGLLINLVTVGDDGRYEFRNVPLILGANEFRLVFYGALGEVREQRESRTVTSVGRLTNLPTYSAAIFKPGNPLFPLEEVSQDSGPLASAFNLQRAFSNGLSASAGLSFVDAGKPSTGSLDTGISSPLLGGVASLQSTVSFDTGWNGTAIYRTRYRGQSIGLQVRTTRASSPSNEDAFRVDASGGIPIVGSLVLPYVASIERRVFENRNVVDTARLGNSTGLGRYRLSNSIEWTRFDSSTSEELRTLTGSLQNSVFISPFNVRLGAAYRLIETRELQRVDGDVNWNINNRAQARFGYQRFLLSKRTAYSLGGNYRFDRLILSPTLTYDSNEQLFALLSVSFAAGREPISGRVETQGSTFTGGGAVAARVYRDENLNRKLDPGEQLLPDVRVEAVHANKSETTNEDGIAFIKRLPPYLLTDVRVRAGSLPDPFLASLEPGRSVLPRPGRTNVIDFPVALTTEIEGSVVALREEGGNLGPVPGVTVELRNEDGEVIDAQQTLFDGFFLFVGVFPGTYTIRLAPENVTSAGLVIPAPRLVPVPLSAEPILGVQIVTGPPGLILPAPADVKITAVNLGTLQTSESAEASVAIYRQLYPEVLGELTLETPLDQQTAPYELVLGRLSQGAAEIICGRLKVAKVQCEIVTFPYVAEPPLTMPTPAEAVSDSPTSLPLLNAPSDDASAAPVMVDLGRYPTAARADVAWSLLRRLYATGLAGADRQNIDDGETLVVGPLPHGQGAALCEALGDSVSRCLLQPISSDAPMAALSPTLPPLRPVGPIVSAEPVPVVDTEPLPPTSEIIEADEAMPSESQETVVAVRLGEYGSQTGVDAGWQLMRRLYPDALRRAMPLESADPTGERRPLLVGPFTELDALSVCARLIADGQSCRVTRARL
jgi:hypothetical protein